MRCVWIVAVCTFGAVACSGTTPSGQSDSTGDEVASDGPRPIGEMTVLHPGVAAMDVSCAEHATESCNALDDDCDGITDEGCGYSGGALQVTVMWNTGADLDLYVTDPAGQTLYYNEQARHLASGGTLDHDARGDCRTEQPHTRIENAFWPGPRLTPGSYRVALHYWGPCGQAGRTVATLTVAVGGKRLGTYNVTLTPEARLPVVDFTVR